MKQRILLLLIITITVFTGCEKDDGPFHKDGLWIPALIAERGDQRVSLSWHSPGLYLAIYPAPDFADPDNVDIYISNYLDEEFQLYKTIKGSSHSYEITALENGKACYLYVKTRKKGYDSRISKKVMVIPSEPEEASVIKNIERTTLGLGDIKNDFSEIAYTNWDFTWNGGANCCINSAVMLYSTASGSTSVIDTSCYGGSLHPTKSQLIYVSDKGERTVDGHRPSYFVLYDVDTETYTYYRDEDNDIRYPVFTHDGERIIYIKNPPGSGYEIWQMNTQTEEKVELIAHNPFSDNSLLDPDKPALSPDDNSLYFEAARSNAHGGPLGIWKYSLQHKTINTVFESVWDDTNPAVSPNGEMLAFISDRSGIENIWVYNFNSGEYIQVTGSEDFSCRKGLGLLRWKDNDTIVFCGQNQGEEGILSVGF